MANFYCEYCETKPPTVQALTGTACYYHTSSCNEGKIKSRKMENYIGDIKILALRKDYEEQMEQFFDHEKFKGTNIYSFFCRIKN